MKKRNIPMAMAYKKRVCEMKAPISRSYMAATRTTQTVFAPERCSVTSYRLKETRAALTYMPTAQPSFRLTTVPQYTSNNTPAAKTTMSSNTVEFSSPVTMDASRKRTANEALGNDSKIFIDGSQGEGGGQILRNAITYACILQKDLAIHKIRAGRSKPGLNAQHVIAMQLVSDICGGGSLQGAVMQSQEVHYVPPQPTKLTVEQKTTECRTFIGDTKTAGSICLLLQAALPCALLGRNSTTQLVLKGGTNATMAPQYDYWERVLLPTLQQHAGLSVRQVTVTVIRRGYFPRGGGEVHVCIEPCQEPLKPIRLNDPGQVSEVYIRSFHTERLPRHLAKQMADACKQYLQSRIKTVTTWQEDVVTETRSKGNGMGILVVAKTTTGCLLAGSAISSPNEKAHAVGIKAAEELWRTIVNGGCVDEWLQDQLVLFMAFAEGISEIVTGPLTLHTRTAIMVAEQMTGATFHVTRLVGPSTSAMSDRIDVYGQKDISPGKHLIRCKGIGLKPHIDKHQARALN
jgi:RNA 3'-terminal phosphate cyclase (ATP)